MVIFPAESDVLAGHVVEGGGRIPRFERVARTLSKIWRAGECRGSVDRRQQHQVASGIVDLSAAKRDCIQVAVEPEAVVNHVTEEALLGTALAVAEAAPPATAFASGIDRHGECCLGNSFFRTVIVLDLNTVICVPAGAARYPQGISADTILISKNGQPSVRTPEDLAAEAGP